MADFTIKPASGTGNKLILQTQAETDVLTTSDSGVTLASATLDAPTIADLSNVTGNLPVGVTGGSGLTALGTVATGNLSNSAIVYPAGHVIGVQHIVDTSAFTSSSTGYAVACSSAAYTIKNASSTLWITGHFQLNFSNSNAKIKYVWSTNDFTNVTTISESDSWGIRNNNAGLIDFLVPFSEKYTHGLAVGATIRFRIYANRQGGGGTTSLNANDSARMTILEVM